MAVTIMGDHPEGRWVSGFGEANVPCYPATIPGTWYAIHGVPVSFPAGRRAITVGGVGGPPAWEGEIEVLEVAPEEQRLTFVKKRRYLTEKLSPGKAKALKAALRSETGLRRWRETFLWPVMGRTVAEFGVKRVYNRGFRESWHKGLDLSVPWGTPVVAAASGTVALTGAYGANGNVVVLDHGHGVVTFYGHLSRMLVARGQAVSAGQLVGRVGSTGLSTAPHLHWGVYVHGVAVRPNDWTVRGPLP